MAALFLRPDADQTGGNWLNEAVSNTNLFASVDEATTPSDTDYISSASDGDKVRLRLSDPSATVVTPLIVRYRCKRVGTAAANLTGRLYQGTSPGTLITQWTQLAITDTFTTYTKTLTSAEFTSITDFTDLYVELELSQQPSLMVDLNFVAGTYYDANNVIGMDSAHLLLHCDGADASTTFIDATGRHHIAVSGGAQIDDAQSKFGGTSLLLTTSGDLLTSDVSADFTVGTGDFTIEFWYRPATSVQHNIFQIGNGGDPVIYKNTSDKIIWNAAGVDRITGTTTLANNTWYHVALTRSSGIARLFLNGTQEGSNYSDSFSYPFSISVIRIGQPGTNVTAWFDEIRFLKGTALWTSTFTPPSAPYNVSVSGPYTLLSVSRASVGYAKDSSGTWIAFSANELRITDLGLSVEDSATNNLLNSAAPATQTTASLATGDYTLWVEGSGSALASAGSATITGAASATQNNPDTFTVTVAGTVTVTVTGSLTRFQLELGTFPSSFILTTGGPLARAADAVTVTGNLDTLLSGTNASILLDIKRTGVNASNMGIVGKDSSHFISLVGSTDDSVTSYSTGVTPLSATYGNSLHGVDGVKQGVSFNASGRSVVGGGGTVNSDSLGSLGASGYTLGATGGLAVLPFVYFRRLTVWNSTLADVTMQALTAP